MTNTPLVGPVRASATSRRLILALGVAPAVVLVVALSLVPEAGLLRAAADPWLSMTVAALGVGVAADRLLARAFGALAVREAEAEALRASVSALSQAVADRDHALDDALAEKDDLLREIHHRVKNNLQVVSSLLNIQQRALSDPAARSVLSDTRQRIAAMAHIYRALYEGPDIRKVDLRGFLGTLVDQLLVDDMGAPLSVPTIIDVDELIIDPDRLAPLSLFAVEAIVTMRRCGATSGAGRLIVRFRVHGESADFTISTMTGDPDRSEPPAEGVSRTLMLAFARQLGGQVSFEPNESGDSSVRLTFPTPSTPGAD